MAEHNEIGKWGEEVAVKYLHKNGYTIRECDWRCGHRDIDIIAISPDQRFVVFVEVKTRSSDEIILPEEAVNKQKIRNLRYAANAYVKLYQIVLDLRFDIITIVGNNQTVPIIDHIEDAFNPMF
jgi:putative endonuclease